MNTSKNPFDKNNPMGFTKNTSMGFSKNTPMGISDSQNLDESEETDNASIPEEDEQKPLTEM